MGHLCHFIKKCLKVGVGEKDVGVGRNDLDNIKPEKKILSFGGFGKVGD